MNDFLLKTLESGGRAVVLIDEAQNIPMATLEQIRILSNLETNKEKLLQIVLVGQLNLIDVLSQPTLRQLFQRVSIKCELSELSETEIGDYLRHRLAIAGATPSSVSFAPDGTKQIYDYSGGIPRLINLIADRSLLAGMALGAATLDSGVTRQAIDNLQLKKPARGSGRWGRMKAAAATRRAAVVLGLSILLAMALIVMINGFAGT